MMEIETMSAKILPAIAAGLLLGTTSLTSAQALVVPQYGYNYSYYAAPVYPPEVTFGFGAAPGYVAPGYYAPGYYGYAPPAYVAPPYTGWNNAGWGYW
jgi:hypothetical protein